MPYETKYVPTTLEPATPEQIRGAVSLKCANCYGAMSFANAIGGALCAEWVLCHAHTLKALLAFATAQGISLDGLLSAVDKTPVQETLYYRRAAGLMTEAEFQVEFSKWQRGE